LIPWRATRSALGAWSIRACWPGLGDVESVERPAVTVLRGPLEGQERLHDLLEQLWARGVELVEVLKVDADE